MENTCSIIDRRARFTHVNAESLEHLETLVARGLADVVVTPEKRSGEVRRALASAPQTGEQPRIVALGDGPVPAEPGMLRIDPSRREELSELLSVLASSRLDSDSSEAMVLWNTAGQIVGVTDGLPSELTGCPVVTLLPQHRALERVVRSESSATATRTEVCLEGRTARCRTEVLWLRPSFFVACFSPGRAVQSDDLTTVPTERRTLLRALEKHAEVSDGPIGLILADIDDFGLVNDTLGHAAGNRVLTQVGDRLRRTVRTGDEVYRLAGDEFGIVLTDLRDDDGVNRWRERVEREFAEPFSILGRDVFVSLSLGVALLPPCNSPRSQLAASQLALHRARRAAPHGYVVYEPEMHTQADDQLRLRTALKRAVRAQEITLHYQPIIDIRSSRIRSFEALARWTDPEFGSISPAVFVPLVEEMGLMAELERHILTQACVDVRAHLPTDTKVNVNVAASGLSASRCPRMVAEVLEQTGVPGHRLRLEVTERALVADPAEARKALNLLRNLNVDVTIDDFGTGYSSLAYLHQLPVDGLKIDRSFITDLNRDPTGPIVRTVLALARELDLSVTAEGVENEHQLARLAELRCELAQGFLFARPAPVGHAFTATATRLR